MIVKENSSSSKFKIPYVYLILVVVIGGLLLLVNMLNSKSETTNPNSLTGKVYCDAEVVEGDFFVTDTFIFGNAKTRSAEIARSGSSSSKIEKKHKYGMSYTFENFRTGELYLMSIWRWTETPSIFLLAINGNPEANIYVQSNQAVERDENGWEKIEIEFEVPDNENLKKILVFPYMAGDEGIAYFDDMTIAKMEDDPETLMDSLGIQNLRIYLDDQAMRKLQEKRDQAVAAGVLITEDDDWVDAQLISSDNVAEEVKMRLKGDWTDHLKGENWSYRVKMPSDKAWNRLQTFSLQDPFTRFYLKEWLFHEMLVMEDVIAPRYDFVRLKINNEKKGWVYAYEEHFDKQIAEYRNRREGVIVKFSEDAFWEQRASEIKSNANIFYESNNERFVADILAFKEKRTMNSPNLKEQFEEAKNLMYAYKYGLLPPSEIFDVDKMARYYAIVDVMEAYHASVWHNQRFYYNPINKKLEPIGFDGYTENGEEDYYKRAFFGAYQSNKNETPWSKYYKIFFRDHTFSKLYAQYLEKFGSLEYLQEVFRALKTDIRVRESLIRESVPDYKLDKNRIIDKGKNIQIGLKAYNDVSLKVYVSESDALLSKVKMTNFHFLPLEIVGSGKNQDYSKTKINPINEIILSNAPHSVPDYLDFTIPSDHQYVFFKVAGLEDIYSSRVRAWTYPDIANIKYEAESEPSIPLDSASYLLTESEIVIRPGSYTFSEPMVIPQNKRLIVSDGVQINMIKGAYILSYGPVMLEGKESSPIRIYSEDKSSQGFIVLGAGEQSIVTRTVFDNLTALTEGTWQFTGAVTFHESPVKIEYVTISNIHCEDGLNLIRSEFEARYLNINNTFSDAFDADFCNGVMRNSRITDTGNDGIDFSGSAITINNVDLINIGDKGISAGEEANLIVKSAFIEGADIGVASKDLSRVDIENVQLRNCVKGFAAYQKKPEFGGGFIKIKKYTAEEVKFLKIVEEGSEIVEMPE